MEDILDYISEEKSKQDLRLEKNSSMASLSNKRSEPSKTKGFLTGWDSIES